MGYKRGSFVIYLDTHVLVWLYAGELGRFPVSAQALMEEHELLVSPMAVLELAYLYEIERLLVDSPVIIESLEAAIGLRVCTLPFHRLVMEAITQRWTRDPFDRIIVANAKCAESQLLTKDANILGNYKHAVWEDD